MLIKFLFPEQTALRDAITRAARMDEQTCLERLLAAADLPSDVVDRIAERAKNLVETVRKNRAQQSGVEDFLTAYDLSSEEGIALMCMAEALLRIPDKATVDRLIKDKISAADWEEYVGQSDSFFVNATTWALMLTGKVMTTNDAPGHKFSNALKKLASRSSEPLVRGAVGQAMKIMGRQFVMGETIEAALKRAKDDEKKGYRHSFDMLGEAARTAADADRYFNAYHEAIEAIGRASAGRGPIAGPGISIKLSALHPRYEVAKHQRVMDELVPRVLALAVAAKAANIGLTIDAEEAHRLELSLDVIQAVFIQPDLKGWEGFGLAVQAYQKRGFFVLDWLAELARSQQRRLTVRLIKGAYWDYEIKNTQELGLENYPVFTRKAATDVSYIACVKKILDAPDAFYPQFATHNAFSVATILELAGMREYEFQRLHGMGQALYDEVVADPLMKRPCRIYAPVGSHEDLLPYLVRRLLENGANSSFVNRIADPKIPLGDVIANPLAHIRAVGAKPHPGIPLPAEMLYPQRENSAGLDLSNVEVLRALSDDLQKEAQKNYWATPFHQRPAGDVLKQNIISPADHRKIIGYVVNATGADAMLALDKATAAFPHWNRTSVETRAHALTCVAHAFESHQSELISLLVREAGKTIPDAIAEVREAVDFCHYYSAEARRHLEHPITLPGPTGELNQLFHRGRGPIICISPWNFPLAIFAGQVLAAVVAGNSVIAKPAEQTPLIAARVVELMHEAGIPTDVVQLLPGRGEEVGAALVSDPRVKGVMFTGSTATACAIHRAMAARDGAIAPLIAETGGQNAMIVDSSALPEQVVADAISSAFGSAGQRCSALRVLFVQEDVAGKIIQLLKGAMAELEIGDPALLSTDVGPVIDQEALTRLNQHVYRMEREAELIYQVPLARELMEQGTFFAPRAYVLDDLSRLTEEVFGPILHVIPYKRNKLDHVIDAINNTGYGLTLGIHSRINETIRYICDRVHVGNTYINRNMVGAVVGVQPFGGEGLSGTGPKAGGPHYLFRLCTEQTVSTNTTASGGNATLLSLKEE